MQVHPYAESFPMLEPAEINKLAGSIKEGGQKLPIIRRKSDGLILDGRNRLRACEEIGVHPIIEDRDLDEAQSLELIADLNIERRHLTESQRGALADEYMQRYQQATIAKPSESPSDLSANPPVIQDAPKKRGRPSAGKEQARKEAAKKFNVSETTVKVAGRVREEAPELVEPIKNGELTLNAAAKEIKRKKETTVANVRDAVRNEIGDAHLKLVFLKRYHFKEIRKQLADIHNKLFEFQRCPSGVGGDLAPGEISVLQKLIAHILEAEPYALCPSPHCDLGQDTRPDARDDHCYTCSGSGWVNKSRYKKFKKGGDK